MEPENKGTGARAKRAPGKDKVSATTDKLADTDLIHQKAMEARKVLKFETNKLLSYMPRSKEAWASQFFIASLLLLNLLTHPHCSLMKLTTY